MFSYPRTWVPANYTWFQGNNNYECFVTRIGYRGRSKFKICLFTKNGTHLHTEFEKSLKRAMKFCFFFLDKESF